MRNTLIIAAVCLAVLLAGVWLYVRAPGSAPIAGQPAQAPTQLKLSILDQGTSAAQYTVRKNYAIYDPAAFATFWKNVHGATATVPAVDFTKQFVIAAFAGTKPTGGYGIGVEKVVDADGKRTATIRLEAPGAGCVTTQATTQPYAFVVVSAGDALPITHEDDPVIKDCK